MKSKSQVYADIVFPKVAEIAEQQSALRRNGKSDKLERKYKSLCKRSGSLVRNSGLMQTVAFFRAKGLKPQEAHHNVLLGHIETGLRDLSLLDGNVTLFERVQGADLPLYMHLTHEVLNLFNWHKRLADTLIDGTADHDEEDGDD